jgi:Mrp family chromosome partitioning ATPase
MPIGVSGDEDAKMHVIPAGPLPPNPTDLMISERMESLISEATGRYDLVVFDTPPTIVSDAIPVVKAVSGVIVVTHVGRTTRDAAIHLSHQLANLGAQVLGVVANGLSGREPGYYGYAYGYPPASATVTKTAPLTTASAHEPAVKDGKRPTSVDIAAGESEDGSEPIPAGEARRGLRERSR